MGLFSNKNSKKLNKIILVLVKNKKIEKAICVTQSQPQMWHVLQLKRLEFFLVYTGDQIRVLVVPIPLDGAH